MPKKIKVGAYVINLDECKRSEIVYFDIILSYFKDE